ncbi:MAG: diguanylate cyclase [Colwelliaceae bacterium]|nr:diguanylate cyclase [Colwelliaceae bacterium]
MFVSGWADFNGSFLAVSDWIIGFIFLCFLYRQTLIIADEQSLSENEALVLADKYQASYKELLIQQEEDQELLEARVQERTLELNIALQELEEANRELEQKNTMDELTGLFNRRYYDQKLLAEFRRSRRNLTPLSLVVIDIDHFKSVNDNYGHSAGDKCLVTLGKLIKQILRRSSDIGCRYGGEEFCLILPETTSEGAIAFAQELRELVMSSSFDFDSTSINLTISCGICTYQQEKEAAPVDIFNAADKALYQAKVDGRNQVQIKEIIAATISPQSGEKNER